MPEGDSDSGKSFVEKALIALFGSGIIAFLSAPRETVIGWVETWVVDAILVPIASAFISAFATAADGLLFAAFGSDRTPFVYPATETATPDAGWGIIDIPAFIVQSIIAGLGPAGDAIIGTLESLNVAIYVAGEAAGPFGIVIIPLLWMLLVAGVLGLGWWLFRAVDVPLVDQGVIVSGLTAPLRWMQRWIGL